MADKTTRATQEPELDGVREKWVDLDGATWARVVGTVAGGFAGSTLTTIVTVGTTALPLPAATLTRRRSMLIQADPANTAIIYIGGSAVVASTAAAGGIQLNPGQSLPIDVGAALIYAISTAASQKVICLEAS